MGTTAKIVEIRPIVRACIGQIQRNVGEYIIKYKNILFIHINMYSKRSTNPIDK